MAFRTRQFDARRGRLRATESLAGWIFADMLLVLFLVGLGMGVSRDITKPEPEPEPTPTQQIVGMETDPVKKTISIDASGLLSGSAKAEEDTCKKIRKAFANEIDAGAEAALILSFAGSQEPSRGKMISKKVGDQLTCASKTLFTTEKERVFRPYWDGKIGEGKVQIEVFLFQKTDVS